MRDWKQAQAMVRYLKGFQGDLYSWGKQATVWDCSGLGVEGLRAVGVLEPLEDINSQGMANRFQKEVLPMIGRLALYGPSWDAVGHVMVCLDDTYCFGAAGGTSDVNTEEEAIAAEAFVKMRPIGYRKDLLGFVDPFFTGHQILEKPDKDG